MGCTCGKACLSKTANGPYRLSITRHLIVVMIALSALHVRIASAQKLRSWHTADFDLGLARPIPTSAPGFASLDGVMYQFGGNTPEGRSGRLYKYDPSSSPTWILLDAAQAGVQGKPPAPRSRFDITALQGCVYVFGGWTASGYANDLHQFNTRAFIWKQLDNAVRGVPPSPRYFFGIAALGDAMYIFGGMAHTGSPTNDLFKFEPLSMAWTSMAMSGDVPAPRFSHAFTAVGDALYSFSGTTGAAYSDEFFKFDLGTSTWTKLDAAAGVLGLPPTPRVDSKFGVLDGSLYLFGGLTESDGYSNQLFQFSEDVGWADLTPDASGQLPKARSRHGFAPNDGALYVFGAISDEGRLNDVFRFSVKDVSWARLDTVPQVSGSVPSERYGHALAQLDGLVYMFGGTTSSGRSNDFAKWDQSTWTWTSINAGGAVPSGRFGHGFEALGSALFVFGGETDAGVFSDELYMFEVGSSTWIDLSGASGAPAPRAQHGFCAMKAALFVFGGLTAGGPSSELFKYVHDSASWIAVTAANPPSPRYGSSLAAVQGVLYTFGGVTSAGYSSELFKCQVAQDGSAGLWTKLDAAAGVQELVLQATSGHALFSSGVFVYLFGGWRDTQSLNADGSQGVYFNHLYRFDTSTLVWSKVISTASSEGDMTPNPRRDFGIALVRGSVVVFGGSTRDLGGVAGGFVNDMRTRMLPRDWEWPDNGLPGFLPIFDEDVVKIQSDSILDVSIDLCSGQAIQCSMTLVGAANSRLSRTIDGQLGCHARLGCTSITMQQVNLFCDNRRKAETGPLQISGAGAALIVSNSSISGCSSVQDGGSLRVHDGATLSISHSSISHSSSQVSFFTI